MKDVEPSPAERQEWLTTYRASPAEVERTHDLLRLVPKGRSTVLDIGARDGHFSRPLAERFETVTALDLIMPEIDHPRVVPVIGDVTRLDFPDAAFDCVFCVEVLEHVPDVARACAEIRRVAAHEIVIGVPYRQDTRVGRVTCRTCGRVSPPWGHLHRFDEDRLVRLFGGLRVVARSFVGEDRDATNALSARLMDWAGNPWGTYDQGEGCVHCGARVVAPASRTVLSRVLSGVAERMNRVQSRFTSPHPTWIHLVLSKDR